MAYTEPVHFASDQTEFAPTRVEYDKGGPSLFGLAISTALLTVLTLGIYRFWMTTRLRRHYWGAIRVMGDPFEYTGTGLEKLLGFLLAVIILAVYLTIVNLGLVFVGLVSTDDALGIQLAVNLSILFTLPLIYFAMYRARRYVLARTRWRGIRFGMEPAAWGYCIRAIGYGLLTILTLGLLYPLQHFRLTQFMTDRTWFGDQRFHQDGKWTGLFAYWAWVYAAILVTGLGFAAIVIDPENPAVVGIAGLFGAFGYIAVFIAALRYRVVAFRYLWGHRSLGGARFSNDIDTAEVLGVTIAGSMAVFMAAFMIATFIVLILGAGYVAIVGLDEIQRLAEAMENGGADGGAAAWPLFAGMANGYLSAIVFAIALNQIFLVRPILRRQAAGMQITNAEALARVAQRQHDEATEAGGFADALGVDIGTGF